MPKDDGNAIIKKDVSVDSDETPMPAETAPAE